MSRKIDAVRYQAGKQLLNKAFADLRKQGIMAKQNYLCCMGCASSSLGEEIKKAHAEHPNKYLGGAYYHSQDAEDLRERGYCHIGYGAAPDAANEELLSLTVGQAVKMTLERYGLKVEWPGTTDQRIKVLIPIGVG